MHLCQVILSMYVLDILLYRGRLWDYGIRPHSVLHMVLRLRGTVHLLVVVVFLFPSIHLFHAVSINYISIGTPPTEERPYEQFLHPLPNERMYVSD
jgi:hypothetical protein